MKKRLVALVLSFVLLAVAVCLGGCTNPTAYSLVTEASKKTESLDSYAAKMTMNIGMTLSNETITIPAIVYEISASGVHTENPVMRIYTTSTSESGESQIDMYVENGNHYISMMGEKYQVPASLVTDDMRVDNTLDGIMAEIPENLFEGIEIEERADGSKAVIILPSKDAFNEIYSELLDQITSSIGAGDASVELSDTKIEIVVDKNGYISAETVSFTMKLTMTAMGTTMEVTAKADVKVEYINPGSDVTVTAPEGYKDYAKLG